MSWKWSARIIANSSLKKTMFQMLLSDASFRQVVEVYQDQNLKTQGQFIPFAAVADPPYTTGTLTSASEHMFPGNLILH